MNTIDFVKSLYAAFTAGRIDQLLDQMSPDIEWASNADPALLPWGGERRGRDGARSFFAAIAQNVDYESFTPLEFFAGSDFVTVTGHTRGRMRRSGTMFEDEWMHLFRIRDGKVTGFRAMNDTHAAVQAYFGGDIHAVGVSAEQMQSQRPH